MLYLECLDNQGQSTEVTFLDVGREFYLFTFPPFILGNLDSFLLGKIFRLEVRPNQVHLLGNGVLSSVQVNEKLGSHFI